MVSLQESTSFPSENQCSQKLPPCHYVWLLRAHRSLWLHVLEALTKWHDVWITWMTCWWDSWKKTNVITGCSPMEYSDFYPSRVLPCPSFVAFNFFTLECSPFSPTSPLSSTGTDSSPVFQPLSSSIWDFLSLSSGWGYVKMLWSWT